MMMRAMRQAAHAIAIRHARIHGARQQSQRHCQQGDNHENGLHLSHRQKLYHSRTRLVNRNPRSRREISPPVVCAQKNIAVRSQYGAPV